jgi:DNA-binding transcriptional LysR family regulator
MEASLDVGRLRLLTEVAMRGSIAAAARVVGLSSSAVSQQLAILEREAGTPLLDRSPRGVLLTAGDLDVAVVDVYDGVPVPFPDYLTATELLTEPLVVVSRPGVLPGRPSLAGLAERDWVMPPMTAACGQAVRLACRAEGFEPRVRWETDDMLLLVRAVAAGHGIAVLPRLAVADNVAEVVLRPLHEPRMNRRLIALTRTSSQARPVVRAVLAELAKAG